MSTHNMGFYEEISSNYPLIVINYHQKPSLSGLLRILDSKNKITDNHYMYITFPGTVTLMSVPSQS